MSEEEKRMTFTEHLAELRLRIIWSMIAVVSCALICYALSNLFLEMLTAPLTTLANSGMVHWIASTGGAAGAEAPKGSDTLYVFNPLEPVLLKLKVAAYGGFLLAFPFIVYQAAAFIFPGLKPRERRAVKILIFGGGTLAAAGVLVAYFLVLPFVLPFLATWVPPGWKMQFRATETLNIVVILLAGFAIAFQYPMAVLSLVYLDLVTPATLRAYRRLAIVGLTVAAAILTPPDPFSILFMLAPLVLLYEGTILIACVMVRAKKSDNNPAPVPGG